MSTLAKPLARLGVQWLHTCPKDLYIPPDALEVFLEQFEGPLDLLLYLIRKQNLDILNIPILRITEQYLHYVEQLQAHRLELAADYLVMAATLAEIKARCLLPKPAATPAEEADPRLTLANRLLEYERYRKAAQMLGDLPQAGDAFYPSALPQPLIPRPLPAITAMQLAALWQALCQQQQWQTHHHIHREALSVRARMVELLSHLGPEFTLLTQLLQPALGRAGVVVTLLALLELAKVAALDLLQSAPYEPLYVKQASST